MMQTIPSISPAYQRGVVAQRENLQLWRDWTIAFTALIAGLLFAFATFSGMRATDAQERAHASLAVEDQARFELLLEEFRSIPPDETGASLLYTAADPVTASVRAAEHALKPVAPFAFLSVGQSEQYPSFFRVKYDALELINDREVFDNPELTMDGRFDVIFIVIFLAPLLVIIFSFNLISLEKELGAWRMSLAQPIPSSRLIIAKLRARLLWLSLVLLGPLVIALAVAGRGWDDPQNWLMAAILVFGVFLYLCFWLTLMTLFNLLGSSSAANATASVFAWLLIVLVLPSLLQFVGRTIYPAPSQAALVAAEQATWDHTFSHGPEELDHERAAAGYANVPNEAREIPDEWSYLVIFHRNFEKDMADLYAKHDAAEETIANWQEQTAWLSPATAINTLLESVSGGDHQRHAAFLAQTRTFHREFNAFFLPMVYSGNRLTAEDYDAVPRTFTWVEPNLSARLKTPLAMLGALLFATIFVMTLTVLAYRRKEASIAF